MTIRDDKNKYFLVYDHGTSGIKAALASITGRILDFEFDEAFPVPC